MFAQLTMTSLILCFFVYLPAQAEQQIDPKDLVNTIEGLWAEKEALINELARKNAQIDQVINPKQLLGLLNNKTVGSCKIELSNLGTLTIIENGMTTSLETNLREKVTTRYRDQSLLLSTQLAPSNALRGSVDLEVELSRSGEIIGLYLDEVSTEDDPSLKVYCRK